jgi:hypothetical protein
MFRDEVDSRPPRAAVRRIAVRVDKSRSGALLTAKKRYRQHAQLFSGEGGILIFSILRCVREAGSLL